MSSKKTRKKSVEPRATPVSSPEAVAPPTASLWPEEFASPRKAVIIAAVTSGLCFLWLLLGLGNSLLPLKYIGAWWLNFYDFSDLGPMPGSLDIACLLIGATVVFGASLIHPAMGVLVLAAIRPWLDGYTFPADNVYFLWGTILIFVLWGVRALLRGEAIRTGPLVFLLLGLVLLQIVASFDSIQFADSYRQLLLWGNYFFLFLLTLNCLKSDRSIRIVLFALVLFAGLQAAFAVLQYNFIFPYLRVLLTERPDLREQLYGIKEWSPELAHRFNTNRAFGTILQPNTFAAFVILLLPVGFVQALAGLRGAAAPSTVRNAYQRYQALAAGIIAWFVGTCTVFLLIQFPVTYAVESLLPNQSLDSMWANTNLLLGVAVASGAVLGLLIAFHVERKGLDTTGRLLARILYPASALAMAIGLYLSFSRGGMLALIVATAITVVLYRLPAVALPAHLQRLAMVLLLAFGALAVVAPTVAESDHTLLAQAETSSTAPAPGGQSPPVVTQEGRAAELGGTQSFRLRLSYWRVAARIFFDSPINGVGPGAFDWAYPSYQRIGDGDVREAHNGYLQAFAESGIFGGLFTLLFWGGVLLFAALQMIRETDARERLLLAGLFAGLLAFLGHAVIDIDFQHPTLMFYAFLLTGIFFARTGLRKTEAATVGGLRSYLLLPFLAIAALTIGMSMRVYSQDIALSRMQLLASSQEKEIEHRYEVGRFFLSTVPSYARGFHKQEPSIPVRSARALIRDLEALKPLGLFYVRNPTTDGWRRLKEGEMITDDAVLVVKRLWDAFGLAQDTSTIWLAELENIDRRFPHNPELANHLSNWYSLLSENLLESRDMHLKRETNAKQIYWIETAIERNPRYADLYVAAAGAYWLKGRQAESLKDKRAAYAKALEYTEAAPPLAPSLPHYEYLAAFAYEQLAESYDTPNTQDQRNEFLGRGEAHRAKGDAIYARRNELRLLTPMPQYGPPPTPKKEAS